MPKLGGHKNTTVHAEGRIRSFAQPVRTWGLPIQPFSDKTPTTLQHVKISLRRGITPRKKGASAEAGISSVITKEGIVAAFRISLPCGGHQRPRRTLLLKMGLGGADGDHFGH